MSKSGNVGTDPNDAMPAGKPLEHDETAAGRDEVESGDDGFGIIDDEDVPEADRENQAGSEKLNAEKFNRPE